MNKSITINQKELEKIYKFDKELGYYKTPFHQLANWKVSPKSDGILLCKTNLEEAVSVFLPRFSFYKFEEFTVNMKNVYSFYRYYKAREIKVGENAKGYSCEIGETKDFPKLPLIDFIDYKISVIDYEKMFELLKFCPEATSNRYILKGISVKAIPEENFLEICATDGQRCKVVKIRGKIILAKDNTIAKEGVQIIIPANFLKLMKIASKYALNHEMIIGVSDNKKCLCGFFDEYIYVQGKMIEGVFPDYLALFAARQITYQTCTSELKEAVQRYKGSDKQNIILSFSPNVISVRTDKEELGFCVRAKHSKNHKSFNALVNKKYLFDILENEPEDRILNISFNPDEKSDRINRPLYLSAYEREISILMTLYGEI